MLKFLFKNKNTHDIPDFFKEYLHAIENRDKISIDTTRFVAFDTETTGLDVRKDRILSIGAIGITANSINVADSLERYVNQERFNEQTVAIHGILKEGKYERISEEEAIKQFIDYIGNSVLIGHHVGFDIAIVNYALKRMGLPKLKNKAFDTGVLYKKTIHKVNILSPDKSYSLDELCKELKIPRADRHKAAGDAFITALAFIKIISRLKKNKPVTLRSILK